MKAIKKFILERTKVVEPKEVSDDNPLTIFLNTLTKDEKDSPFLELSSDKQFQYVKSIADFQIQAMGDIGEATIKSLTMLAIKLHQENIDEFEISQVFTGSKAGVKEEEFTLKLKKIANDDSSNNKKAASPVIEYGDKKTKEPLEKWDTLFNQENAVFDIMNQLKEKIPMNQTNELPLRTSAILFVAEFMSQINVETLNSTLHGLMKGDTPLNASYQVEAVRKEVELDLESIPKRKLH